jgi:hypothetical protein
MRVTEYEKIIEYLRLAEQSKYSYADIKARFEAEPAVTYMEEYRRLYARPHLSRVD